MTKLRSILVFAVMFPSSFLDAAHPPLNLQAQPFGAIRGTVMDPSGAVVPSAKVTVTNEQTGEQRTTTTTQSGDFRISPLPLGEYKVRIERAHFAVSERKVSVGVGQESTLNIVLFLGSGQPTVGTLKIKLIDTNGSVVAGATVTILAKSGRTIVSDVADQNGSYETTAVNGDYTIKATSGTSRHAEKKVRVKSGETKEVKLTLR
jgi:Carboxypeptidase regulatory-like domain